MPTVKANMVASDGEKHTDEELVAQMSYVLPMCPVRRTPVLTTVTFP